MKLAFVAIFSFSIIYLLLILVLYAAILVQAIYKIIKSQLNDMYKILWVVAIIIFNIIAAIIFIIYHDYFLSQNHGIKKMDEESSL
jgi:hypothetical protein